ncbi:MAG: helix-turn-helix transcriptional regulator [Geobacter sp.]|nr:helix-turn-helix transcriptional regulator [Geobacter sp.]
MGISSPCQWLSYVIYGGDCQQWVSKPYLSQIETGKRQGTVETLSAIANALDVPLDVLTD